jgi:hypothetical protein
VIGPAGGSLASADGRVTLRVPQGALAADQTIGIQAVNNYAPGGQGAAYRLTPDGLELAQPVVVTLQYEEKENNPVGVAVQDAAGIWLSVHPRQIVQLNDSSSTRQAYARGAAALKSLSVTLPRKLGGDLAIYERFYLKPLEAEVEVGKTVELSVFDSEGLCNAPLGQTCHRPGLDDLLVPLVPNPIKPGAVEQWYVNGVPGGTDATGTVDGPSPFNPVTYTAPPQKPSPNTVMASATLDLSGYNSSAQVELFARIRIKASSPWNGTVTYTASGSSHQPVASSHTGEGRKRSYQQNETFTVIGVKDLTPTSATLIFEVTSTVEYKESEDDHYRADGQCAVNSPPLSPRYADDKTEQEQQQGTRSGVQEAQLSLAANGSYTLYLETLGANIQGVERVTTKSIDYCFPDQARDTDTVKEYSPHPAGDYASVDVKGSADPANPNSFKGNSSRTGSYLGLVGLNIRVEWNLTRSGGPVVGSLPPPSDPR